MHDDHIIISFVGADGNNTYTLCDDCSPLEVGKPIFN